MDFQVIFKDSFVADLEQVVKRIAFRNPAAALSLGELITQMAENLCFFRNAIQEFASVQTCADLSSKNISKFFTAGWRNRLRSRFCGAGMVAGSPTPPGNLPFGPGWNRLAKKTATKILSWCFIRQSAILTL